jgi:hypothetical protein
MKNLLKSKIGVLTTVGFENAGDFLATVFAWGRSTLYVLAIALSGIIKAVDMFLEKDVYRASTGIYILFWASLFDMLLGLSKAVRDNNVSGSKMGRAMVRFVVQVFLVGVMYKMHHVWPWAVYVWMVDVILITFVLSTVWSIIKNAKILGYINEETYTMLEGLLSIHALVKKFLPRKEGEPAPANPPAGATAPITDTTKKDENMDP